MCKFQLLALTNCGENGKIFVKSSYFMIEKEIWHPGNLVENFVRHAFTVWLPGGLVMMSPDSRGLLSNIFESQKWSSQGEYLTRVRSSSPMIFPYAIKHAIPFAIPYHNILTVCKHCCLRHGGCAIAIFYPLLQSMYTHRCFR